jgi:hypothetical protein
MAEDGEGGFDNLLVRKVSRAKIVDVNSRTDKLEHL